MPDDLSIQINDFDSYQAQTCPLDQLHKLANKVPIIRVYGSLCVPHESANLAYPAVVHVHNYLPYFYVDCQIRDPARLNKEYLAKLKSYLNDHITLSFKRRAQYSNEDEDADDDDTQEPEENNTSSYIASVEFCRGCPAYGYHLGYLLMIKIMFLLPLYKTRLRNLISQGRIDFVNMYDTSKKPAGLPNVYEAHIPYTSQFLADFNLYGCGYMNFSNCHFRMPLISGPSALSIDLDPLKVHLQPFVKNGNVLSSVRYRRISRSLLEIDVLAEDIFNRGKYEERLNHDGVSEFYNGLPQDKIYLSSLKFTFDDLKYQCTIRNNHNTSQLLNALYSQVFKNIGKEGFRQWEMADRHKELLAYVARLNKPLFTSNPQQYFEELCASRSIGTGFPTCFQHISQSVLLDYYQKVPLLNFRDDLYKWSSYDLLFSPDVSAATSEAPIPQQASSKALQASKLNEVFSDNEVPVSSPISESWQEQDEQNQPKQSSERPSQQLSPSDSEQSHSDFDMHLFSMTQKKRPFSQVENEASSSEFLLLSQNLHFLLRQSTNVFEYQVPFNLKKSNFVNSLRASGMLDIQYDDPYYSKNKDIHAKPLVFANKKIVVPLKDDSKLGPFGGEKSLIFEPEEKRPVLVGKPQLWQYAPTAPSKENILSWVDITEKNAQYKKMMFKSQIEPAVTQTYDFKYSYRSQKVLRNPSGFLNLTNMLMEIHANVGSDRQPDPEKDSIAAIFYNFDDLNGMHEDDATTSGILICLEGLDQMFLGKQFLNIASVLDVTVESFPTENSMVNAFLERIDKFDPDILSGYEINASSWGYLVERYREVHDINLLARLSRSTLQSNGKFGDRWGYMKTTMMKINGRHLLNIWRALRSELALTSNTLETVCFHLLHRTVPKILNKDLSDWFKSGIMNKMVMFCKYHIHRLALILKVISIQETVLRNTEHSRLIGVDFNANFYRGSQFKVESIMLRIAKEENLLLYSPTKVQVHEMKALECIPLVMEPDSGFYKSPLVVLDFQSLYPSIMIAYNYCFTTLLGPVEGFQPQKNTIGCLPHLKLPPGVIDMLWKNKGINVSPNGMMFVTSKFRKSLLSKMLQEILNMRINVRNVAKAFSEDQELGKLYNSKQLALKLIANVTYGYTSASYSGRMPNCDIADAIVSTGREILTKSVEIIENSPFNAKVVYGDTDSLFVYFPGRSKEDAFKYGKQLADEVTEVFPDPIKLKFEKVYHPCVLLAKKRYVGHCFEYELQKEAKFEAKGIETVRRDGVPAQLKMVGKTLRILFETLDLSKVKKYVVDQFYKIFLNKVNVKDFCFARAVRYGTYKNEKYLPPGAIVAQKKMDEDPRSEPQYRERIPYLVIRDSTKERVKDRCVSPQDYIASFSTDNPMELDFEYYVTRVLIPPLERFFNLMGVNIKEWYREMPKSAKREHLKKQDIVKLGDFISTNHCYHCERMLDNNSSRFLCLKCLDHKFDLASDIASVSKLKENQMLGFQELCVKCNKNNFGNNSGINYIDSCINHDCQIYYSRIKSTREFVHVSSETSKVLQDF